MNMQDVQEIRNTRGTVGVQFNMKGTVGRIKQDNMNVCCASQKLLIVAKKM